MIFDIIQSKTMSSLMVICFLSGNVGTLFSKPFLCTSSQSISKPSSISCILGSDWSVFINVKN